MKRWLFVACIAFFGMEAVANNKWGGMGAGLAEGLNMRIQIEQQRRQQELQAQQQRAAEERNRIMREEVRQREIEAQRQREVEAAEYQRHMEREAAAAERMAREAERRAREAEAQRQREADEKERKYWDSRCQFVDGNKKRCEMPATATGYCAAHERQFKLEEERAEQERLEEAQRQREEAERIEAERKRLAKEAKRNRRCCAAYYKNGKQCRREAEDGSEYCKRHRDWTEREDRVVEQEKERRERAERDREKADASRRALLEEENDRQTRRIALFVFVGVFAVVFGVIAAYVFFGRKKQGAYSRTSNHRQSHNGR